MSHLVALSWHWPNQSSPDPNNVEHLARKWQASIIKSLIWLDQHSNLWGPDPLISQNGRWMLYSFSRVTIFIVRWSITFSEPKQVSRIDSTYLTYIPIHLLSLYCHIKVNTEVIEYPLLTTKVYGARVLACLSKLILNLVGCSVGFLELSGKDCMSMELQSQRKLAEADWHGTYPIPG